MTACPVCGATDAVVTVTRDPLPTMQNYVYRTREAALGAKRGVLTLSVCPHCSFAWNGTFDPARLDYDAGYDNAVPSAVMAAYYEEIARYLGEKYDLARGYLVDIGCGNGTFLKAAARVWPECRGLGVDPALPGDSTEADGRVRLVKGVFHDDLLEDVPSLFVCRHVLEHIPQPVPFVRDLRDALGDRAGVPLFVEVPDAGWIVHEQTFWDFCYEHCNYFSPASLGSVLARAGFAPTATRVAFGNQYRWMEAVAAEPATPAPDEAAAAFVSALQAYAAGERQRIAETRARLEALKASGMRTVVWGMATKGVIFSLLVDRDAGGLLDLAVDVNTNKQGCFVPLSGRRIDAPDALRTAEGRLAVLVMNTNYLDEIRRTCAAMGVEAAFFDAAVQAV